MSIQDKVTAAVRTIRASDGYWVERAKLDFIGYLDTALQSSGMNQKQLAAAYGSSPAYITKILRGDTNFTLESMVKLGRVLGCRLQISLVKEAAEMDYNGRPLNIGTSSNVVPINRQAFYSHAHRDAVMARSANDESDSMACYGV